jgi:acyl-CoA dehydrogenase
MLTQAQRDVQGRADELTRLLMAYEEECDSDGLSDTSRTAISELVEGSGLYAMSMPTEWGGAGLSLFDQVLAMEKLGRLSNFLWQLVWKPANVLRYCNNAQRERYLLPAIAGRLEECYSISEPTAGSDPASIQTTARHHPGGYLISGEKWFASGHERADYVILLARIVPEDALTLFLIDATLPGIKIKYVPRAMARGPIEHPQVTYTDVEVSSDSILGDIGAGLDLTKEWFVDERLYIAARCIGGAERALELAADWAKNRIQFGSRIIEHQMVQRTLADCAVEVALNRSLLYQVTREVEGSDDRKTAHAKAAMVKLAASEAAARVVDACVQLFGGRGYMADSPVERLFRSLRGERIWEGTSDIQRVVIARHIEKRGLASLIGSSAAQAETALV